MIKKQYKKRKIGLTLCILMLMAIVVIPSGVDATKKASSNAENSAANTACENALYDGSMLTTTEDINNLYVKVSSKNGLWKVKYYYGDSDDFDYSNVEKASPNGSFTYKGGSTKKITIPKFPDAQLRLVVIAELQGDTSSNPPKGYDKNGKVLEVSYKDGSTKKKTTCRPGDISVNSKSNFSIEGTGAVITKVIKAKTSKQSRSLSANEQKECDAMVQAKYESVNDTTPYLNETQIADYNEQMKQSFPFCYGTAYSASYDITAKTIKKIRQSSLKAYEAYSKFKESAADNKEYENAEKEIEREGYKKIAYSKDGIKPTERINVSHSNSISLPSIGLNFSSTFVKITFSNLFLPITSLIVVERYKGIL